MPKRDESDLVRLLCSITPDVLLPSMRTLIQCLEDEEISSLVGLRDSLLTQEDVQLFAESHSLRPEQRKLLEQALEICRQSASYLISDLLRGARKCVVSHCALAVCTDDFESLQKFRRIESKAQILILGTIHTSVSPLNTDSEVDACSIKWGMQALDTYVLWMLKIRLQGNRC